MTYKNIINYCVIATVTLIITIAVSPKSAIAQLPYSGILVYQGPTLLVIQGYVNSNSTWAAVEKGKQEGYKMDGMSAYTYQTGDATLGYTVYKEVIITMSK